MDWISGRKKTRELIRENRALRAQLKMTRAEIREMAAEQEELLTEIIKVNDLQERLRTQVAPGSSRQPSHFFG